MKVAAVRSWDGDGGRARGGTGMHHTRNHQQHEEVREQETGSSGPDLVATTSGAPDPAVPSLRQPGSRKRGAGREMGVERPAVAATPRVGSPLHELMAAVLFLGLGLGIGDET